MLRLLVRGGMALAGAIIGWWGYNAGQGIQEGVESGLSGGLRLLAVIGGLGLLWYALVKY